MNIWQTLFMGVLQGATELFPVSSLGHAVILPSLLHWNFRQSDPNFVPFLVLLHLGTATALFVIYRQDWIQIIGGFVRAGLRGRIETESERVAMLLLTGTVPAGVLGAVLEQRIKSLFASAVVAAAFLVVNGLVLLGAEWLRRRDERRHHLEIHDRLSQEATYARIAQLRFREALFIGAFQAFALIPGISRSGITLAGGLVAGLRHQEALKFSFLLATPIIAAAGLLEVPQLAGATHQLALFVVGAVLAGLAAYASATFLQRYFRVGRLDPYAYYCLAAGTLSLVVLGLFPW